MWSWVWFGLVWLALIGGFIGGAAWTGYMKSFANVPDDDGQLVQVTPKRRVRHVSDDPNDYWSGNWDGDIR